MLLGVDTKSQYLAYKLYGQSKVQHLKSRSFNDFARDLMQRLFSLIRVLLPFAVLIGLMACAERSQTLQDPLESGHGERSDIPNRKTRVDSQAQLQPTTAPLRAVGTARPARPSLPPCVRDPIRCNKSYLSFAQREQQHARPVGNCATLYLDLVEQWNKGTRMPMSIEPSKAGPDSLRDELLDALNIGFLLHKSSHGVEAPQATAQVLRERDMKSHRLLDVVLHDARVGAIPLLLALPTGKGPFPVVLALPGHGEVPEDILSSLPPEDVAKQGMALIAIGMRAYDSQAAEHEATMALLCHGFSLIGLRVYETMVALKYIAAHKALKPKAIGLLGHSGGSTVLNLLVWISDRPRALISDMSSDYFNVQEYSGKQYVLDETLPRLHRMAPRINDLGALQLPVLQVPYGAPAGPGPLLEFLAKELH